MANQLTEEQIAEFKEAFELFKKEGTETVELENLHDLVCAAGGGLMNGLHLKNVTKIADPNDVGVIEFDQFLKVMIADKNFAEESKKHVRSMSIEAFKKFDKNGSGTVSVIDMAKVLGNMGIELGEQVLSEIAVTTREEANDQVDYEALVDELMGDLVAE